MRTLAYLLIGYTPGLLLNLLLSHIGLDTLIAAIAGGAVAGIGFNFCMNWRTA